jgi:uncharacterized protein (TIGR00369 family)
MKEAFGTVFPIADFLGMRLMSQGDGRAVVTLEATEKHANPMGTLHGGLLCDVADAAMGVAFASTLAEQQSFTTLELKINFLRPFWKGLLTAEAETTSRGRTIGLLTCKVTDEKKRLIASATSTCMVLAGDAAKNR